MIGFRKTRLDQLAVEQEIEVNTLTGTARMSVPIRTSPGRESFGPSLVLGYSSGQRNSTFGVGWSLSGVPSIGVDTTKRLPSYDRGDHFVYGGGQELVPVLREQGGGWRSVVENRDGYRVQRFRSKTERSFERFEQWTHEATGRVHWLAYARNGVISVFGRAADNSTRIADPTAPDQRTFQWLLEAQFHPKGNAVVYQYKAEDGAGVDTSLSFEERRGRRGNAFAQRYLKRILYGNRRPLSLTQSEDPANEWLFEVVFDYGEHATDSLPVPSDAAPAPSWAIRSDAFSAHRPGFELRTYRLCRRILMFHRFPELNAGTPCLVGATELTHRSDPAGTVLESVTYRGYRRNPDGTTSDRAVPSLKLEYADAEVGSAFEAATATDNIPSGLDGAVYQWLDIKNEGLPGVLCRQSGSWYFKENLGSGRFGPMNPVNEVPVAISAAFQLQDFDGDGNLNLVGFEGREAGYYQHNRQSGRWEAFRAFQNLPRVDLANARVQWVDLNGDGHADLIVERSDRLTWYPSEGADGFAPGVELSKPDVGASGAPTLTQNSALRTFFADMTGDGLLDLVRVDSGRVEYWPNLGLGHFGPGVVMENAPTLDDFGEVDVRRLRFVDLDGSGAADLLYIGRGEIRIWTNQSGNRFGAERRLTGLPYIDRLASAQVFDFLGDGTRCLVWSTPLPSREGQAIQYLPLSGKIPPRLLVSVSNSVGRATKLSYSSSAQQYLRDKATDRPWRTPIPRHSMVVHLLEGLDLVGGARLITHYEYRDGYFDDKERRFVGFGIVDAFDSDQLLASGGMLPEEVTPPSVVRTWYHTGEDGGFHRRAQEFYSRDPLAARAPPPFIEDIGDLTTEEQLDAYRAIAGLSWRQEFFALRPDGFRELHPFRTTEFAYRIRRLQPAVHGADAAFALKQTESLNYEYEQDPSDPRVTHSFLLESDVVGNVLARASVAYPRRPVGPEVLPEQEVLHAELTRLTYRNIDLPERFELGIEFEEERHALSGLALPTHQVFSRADLISQIERALEAPLAFHDPPPAAVPRARLIGYRRHRFWSDSLDSLADVGEVGAVTLLHHVERAVFPGGSVDALFDGRVDGAMLSTDGHYRSEGGFWWADDTTYHYRDGSAFFRLREETCPAGGRQTHTFEAHFLLVTAVEDVFGNRVEGTPDYQALASSRVTDANDNISEVLYDPLGVAVATSLRGTQLGSDGNAHAVGDDDLATYVPVVGATAADVLINSGDLLQGATRFFFYDLEAFARGEGPPRSIHLEREQHRHDGEGNAPGAQRIRATVQYVDGFGRAIQTKIRADEGLAIQRLGGTIVVDGDGRPIPAHSAERWLTSGHEVYNNKGWLVRKYEPLFSTVPHFESDRELREYGVATRTHYDPIGRVVRQDLPNGTFSTSEHASWTTRQADANDNVIGSPYEADRLALPATDARKRALDGARAHANTPTIVESDPLGRPFRLRELGIGGTERVTTTVYGPLGLPERVIDPRNLEAFTYKHDMLGRTTVERSMDAGVRCTLLDSQGHPIHQWDARSIHTRHLYDENGRSTETRVDGAVDFDGTAVNGNVIEQVSYGDTPEIPQAKLKNARGRPIRRRDDAGVLLVERYHMDGQALDVRRSLRSDYKGTVDWTTPASIALASAEHRTQTQLDALGRPVEQRLPDGTTREYAYARLGHVSEVRLTTADGSLDRQVIASDIETNARGQRTQLVLGNGVATSYEYDRSTFRLERLHTHRVVGAPRDYLDVAYTYDPAGNITHWIDRVQDPGAPSPLLTGLTVSSAFEFTYDPFYQLKTATGRVHQALLQHDYRAGLESDNPIKGTRHLSLDNGAAVERYTRTYDYDLAGNITRIRHAGATRTWNTEMWTSSTSNRSLPRKDLDGNDVANPEARFDESGNNVELPHLRAMNWNYAGRLSRAVIIDRSGAGQPDDAEYYLYGADGLRVRRVTEELVHGELEVTETTYFEGCEVRRVTRAGNTRLLRQTSHITDGSARLATLHQWSIDQTALETDDIGKKKLHYLAGNHLGSVSLELDEAGDVISYEEYFPFGGTSFLAGKSARDVKLKEYRYSGKCRDDATGFYCYEYRYFAPFIGNWISPDPLGAVDGLNLYRFVHNNPIRFVDSDGLSAALPAGPYDQLEPRRGPGTLPPEAPAPAPPQPPPNPPRPQQGGAPASPPRVEERPSRTPPANAEPESPPEPAVPPSDAGGGDADVPTPISPAPSEANETQEPQPHFSDCECVWVEAGYTTDWETLLREGREVQVWQEGHYECSGPPMCHEGAGASFGLDGDGSSDSGGTGGVPDEAGRTAGTGEAGNEDTTTGSERRSRPTASNSSEARAGHSTTSHSVSGDRSDRAAVDAQSSQVGNSQSTSEEVESASPLPSSGDQRSVPGSELPSVSSGTEAGGTTTSGHPTRAGFEDSDDRPIGLRYDGEAEDAPIDWDRVDLSLTDWGSFAPAVLDGVQGLLDVIGMAPGAGEVADGANGLISLARGDEAGAALSFAAMIPFAGWAATAGKFGRRAVHAAGPVADISHAVTRYGDEAASAFRAVSRNADELATFASRNADEIAESAAAASERFRLFHGTVAANIEGIIERGGFIPRNGQVFFSETLPETFKFGADLARRAAFSIEVEISTQAARIIRTSTPGVPRTVIVETTEHLSAEVRKLFVRRPDLEGGFTVEVFEGLEAIRKYLAQ
jgi:RHS repeat-associated protein